MTPTYRNPPDLDIDARALANYGRRVSLNGRIERRVVSALIEHLGRSGYKPQSIDYGEGAQPTTDLKTVMELVFDLDESWVSFARHGESRCFVLLIQGNGTYIISDWAPAHGPFHAAMKAFDPEEAC